MTEIPEHLSLSEIYSATYYEGGASTGRCAYESYGDSEGILRKESAHLLKKIRSVHASGRLLEIGCAYGFFLMEAASYFDVIGLEISKHAARIATAAGLDVRRTSVQEAGFSENSFEVVVMLDTIEHLSDPRRTLKEIFRIMTPGGLLVITTGDVGSLLARIMGRRWRLMTPPQHTFFFSCATLRKLLTNEGLVDLRVTYPWKFVPVRLILHQAEQWYGVRIPGRCVPRSGGVFVNLFDAMRVTARKSLGSSNAMRPLPKPDSEA